MGKDFDELYKQAHDLIPKELEVKLPSINEAMGQKNPVCPIKIFGGPATFWVAGRDDDYLWGVAEIFERETGSFLLSELQSIKVPPLNLPLERDLYYEPKTISEIMSGRGL